MKVKDISPMFIILPALSLFIGDASYASDLIYIVGELRADTNYSMNEINMTLSADNFTFVDSDSVQLSPPIFKDEQWLSTWRLQAPNASGNYTIELSSVGDSVNETVEIIDMPEKTEDWLNKNAESLLAVSILLVILLFGGIFAYLFINIGKK